MKKTNVIIFFIFVQLIFLIFSCGKKDKSIIIEASSELNPITTYVGKEINYKIKIKAKKNIDYKFYDITFDSTSDKSRILKTETKTRNKGDYKEREINYTIAFYDIGGFVISPFKIDYVYNKVNETIYGEEAKVIIKPFSDGERLPPLKEVLKIKMPFYVWIVFILILTVLILIIFLYFKRKNKKENMNTLKENIFIPEDETALRELNIINIKEYAESLQYASYYFLITEIFKKYLSKRYLVGVLEMTTSDFEKNIKNNVIDNKKDILNFFKYADTVKFAKEKSDYETMKKHFDFCIHYIKKYRAKEIAKQNETTEETNSPDKKN